MSAPLKISLTLGPGVYQSGNFVYVWLDAEGKPFYVGETSQSIADRTGLHIRDKTRSGAVVSKILSALDSPERRLTVMAFRINDDLLQSVAQDNGCTFSAASANRARKAIERATYDRLLRSYPKMHLARGCRWHAPSASKFVAEIVQACEAAQ
jgi:hypothetical protein